MNHETLMLDLGERAHPIHIGRGVLDAAGQLLAGLLPSKRVIIITDENVAPLYSARLQTSLATENIESDIIVIPPGEGTKSLASFASIIEDILSLSPDRKTTLVALGGGVVGDITGYAASSVLRGVPFVQVPTSLLAQVDSSVGGKTGINSAHGKNLIGAFYQPLAVLADMDVLDTLPPREFLAGYAEVVKYGLIDMPEFYEWLEQHGEALKAGDHDARSSAVKQCCAAKARIVEEDEKESGKRALLNLGHTFGHALEKEMGYDGRLLHGEAVAIGMLMAYVLSERMGEAGNTSTAERTKITKHFQAMGLPTTLADIAVGSEYVGWDAEQLARYCLNDKKAENGALTFILMREVGDAFIAKNVKLDDVIAVFAEFA